MSKNKITNKVMSLIEYGSCECINEPRGLNGLEGYQLGSTYRYEKILMDDAYHYRVYPSVTEPKYYETCGPKVFWNFFKLKE